MDQVQIGSVVIVPLIVGLVEVAKRTGLPSQYAAPLSLAFGLAISLGAWLTAQAGGGGLFDATLLGLAVGLSASGLYSITRSAAGG